MSSKPFVNGFDEAHSPKTVVFGSFTPLVPRKVDAGFVTRRSNDSARIAEILGVPRWPVSQLRGIITRFLDGHSQFLSVLTCV